MDKSLKFNANLWVRDRDPVGLSKTHSCETTLINLIENWRHARDNKHRVGILSTDMSKAFNSMHPALLLSKLGAYGFEENFIDLLCSYLCGRSNGVKLASRQSSWKRVN